MKIVAADWLPYSLPLRRPWQTSRGTLTERCGRLLRLTDADGRTGWGDCAPLPEFGLDEAAATAFAEDCARQDLAAQQAGVSLGQWLRGEPIASTVAVNLNFGPIFKVDRDNLQWAAEQGFAIVKCKVGHDALDDEIAALHRLAHDLPSAIRLRLDANGAWTAADARRFVDACAGLPVDGLEEPLAAPDQRTLADLQARAAFPLAIDESVHLLDRAFFQAPAVRRIVLKPARHGPLATSIALANQAATAGLEVIVTSALESACGLAALAHVAAALAPDATHGLATADLFASNVGAAPLIAYGRLHLADVAGCGFQVGT